MRARGAFIVSSELREDGSIPGVLIESLSGNICTLVNPWEGKKVSVLLIDGKNRRIRRQQKEQKLIEFSTEPGSSYLILPAGEEPGKPGTYRGSINDKPKKFLEAILGKLPLFS